MPDAAEMRIAIVVSEWNEEVTGALAAGARQTLLKHGLKKKNLQEVFVPGSYELPVAAQFLLEADKKLDSVICLGCVIQGETKHFDFICEAAAQGIKDVSLKYNKPVIFGVLTPNSQAQALDRSGGKYGNKGDEAAITAIKMVALKNSLG